MAWSLFGSKSQVTAKKSIFNFARLTKMVHLDINQSIGGTAMFLECYFSLYLVDIWYLMYCLSGAENKLTENYKLRQNYYKTTKK